MTRLSARWRPTSNPHGSALGWQLVVTEPDGTTKAGPTVFSRNKPSRDDAERIVRRLMRRRYWRMAAVGVVRRAA